MIPSLKPFGDVTFSDLSWPEDRRRRAEELLERFDFPDVATAFAKNMGTGGCWRRVIPAHQASALPYRLGEFCARHNIHTREIAAQTWTELYIHGANPEEASERASDLKYMLDEADADDNSNAFDIFNNHRLFERYNDYYGERTYQTIERMYLVFAIPGIMHHVQQMEISPIGWALWKYAITANMAFGFHPTWVFEKKHEYVMTQGSGYEYVIRTLPDPHARGHVHLTHPAFMFDNLAEALEFRTTLDMLGFYDQESRKFEPLVPKPMFYQSTSGSMQTPRNQIRAANFEVV